MNDADDIQHVARLMMLHHGIEAERHIAKTLAVISARGGSADFEWWRAVLARIVVLRELERAPPVIH